MRRGAIIGAVAGLVITLGLNVIMLGFSGGGEMRVPAYYAYLLWAIVVAPAVGFSKCIGWPWHVDSAYAAQGGALMLLIVTNTFLCALFGCVTGYVFVKVRSWHENYEKD